MERLNREMAHLVTRSDTVQPNSDTDLGVPMESLPPQTLARLCQQTLPEDTRAFQALVGQFKERVYATAYRLMGSRQDAEDQAQEVFIKVYRGIQDLDDPAAVTAWIYRLTVNICFDALRKHGRSPITTEVASSSADRDEEPQVADPNVVPPEEIAVQRELRECMEDVLQRLDPVERGVLVLRDVEDRPYQEIAETLAIGLAATKMRIHRARLAFQQIFESLCAELWRPVRRRGVAEG
ncbi:MAG: sigma-70 family polymerase sigma factor [Thermomicrobiales bacterium]|nr:sigma-70 family polymerase sigma factor [Thermomicrobiales bacterium]MDF3017149.1 sigma-70 family polymerase sigma factor [Thermomicrobiales bacterium]